MEETLNYTVTYYVNIPYTIIAINMIRGSCMIAGNGTPLDKRFYSESPY
jgi:hypothetical protein